MELLANLALGFDTALTLHNLLYCFTGVLIGTLVGVLPGIGPVATIAMLLPVTFTLAPVSAMIMLAGIYYGAQYGGSTSAILINLPGEITSVATTSRRARHGQTGPRRRGVGHRRHRLVRGGHHCHVFAGRLCAAARRAGTQVRTA